MNETHVTENGITYTRVKVAAQTFKLAPDYISRMCRAGDVRAIRQNGLWYVDESSLGEFLKKQAAEYEQFRQRKSEEGKQLLRESEHAMHHRFTVRPHPGLRAHHAAIARKRERVQTAIVAVALLLALSSSSLALTRVPHAGTFVQNAAHVAAVSSGVPVLDSIADAIFRFLCPLFNDCPQTETQVVLEPASVPVAQTPPQRPAAMVPPVQTQPQQQAPQPAQQTIVNQPVIERVVETVRTVVESAPALADSQYAQLSARIDGLTRTLEVQIDGIARSMARPSNSGGGGSTTIVQGGSGTVTSVDASGGTTGLIFTGGPIVSSGSFTLAGTLNVANGGTGTSTAPTAGQLLVGDGAGGYTLMATSSLGIIGASSSPSGPSGAVQFSDAGVFNGEAGFEYDAAADRLSVVNASTSVLSAGTLCLGADCRTAWPTGGGGGSDPFPGGATSTTLTFTNGLLAFSSSTIANLTTTNATTTGDFSVGGSLLVGLANGCLEIVGGVVTSTGADCGTGSGGITSLNGATSSSQTFATSSATDTFAINTAGGTHTFTIPSNVGFFSNDAGYLDEIATSTVRSMFSAGTGLSYSSTTGEFTNAGVLSLGGFTGNVSTSTLGLPTFADLGAYFSLADWFATTTDALDEGLTNFYYTEDRFAASLGATTSVASIQSLPSLTITESQISDLDHYTDADAEALIAGSTTIAKTYAANAFTNTNTFSGTTTLATTTASSLSANTASTSDLFAGSFTLSNLTGVLKAAAGVVTAALVDLASEVSGVLGIVNGGTGTSTAPAAGELLVGNASGDYDLVATSSLGLPTFADLSGYLTEIASSTVRGMFSATGPLQYGTSTGAFSILQSGAAQDGYLSSIDWNLFNEKVSSSSLSSFFTANRDWQVQSGALSPTSSIGILVNASSTIGDGTAAGGLTISGNATTTGNAFFGGNIGIGISSPASLLNAVSGVSDFRFSTGSGGVTPTIAVINTDGNGKAGALAAGQGGAVFAFDEAGFFSIMKETKADIVANNVGAGEQMLTIEPTGDVTVHDGALTVAKSGTDSKLIFSTNDVTESPFIDFVDGSGIARADIFFSNDDQRFVINTVGTPTAINPNGGNVGIGTTTPSSKLSIFGTNSLFDATNAASTTVFSVGQGGATTTNLHAAGTFSGAGLASCSASSSKLLWNSSTQQFECGTDAGAGGGLTSLNGLTDSAQLFATSTAADTFAVVSSGGTHTFTIPSNVGFFSNDAGYLTAISTSSVRDMFSGSAPITYDSGTGAIGFDYSIDNAWTGANAFSATTTLATTTATQLAVAGLASTSALFTESFTLSNLTGVLKAAAGVVTAALVDLASEVTGILAVEHGGTGLENIAAGAVLLGNGTSSLATTTRAAIAETGSSILTITGGTDAVLGSGVSIEVAAASGTASGFLSSADWSLFNNKVSTTTLLSFFEANRDWEVAGNALAPATSTFGILVNASSTIGDGTATGGLTVSGNATTTGNAIFNADIDVIGDLFAGAFETNNSTNVTTFAGQIRASSGSINAPGLGFGSDTDTGFWLTTPGGTPTLHTSVNGVERMTIGPNGNIGMGTTTPWAKLTLAGSDSLFAAVNAASSTVFSVGQNGATTTNMHASGDLTGGGNLVFDNGSALLSLNGDTLWTLASNNTFYTSGANTLAISYGLNQATALQGYDSGAFPVLLQQNGGNVGIGTSNPAAELDVNGTASTTNLLVAGNATTTLLAADTLCLTGDTCITEWPTGGGGGADPFPGGATSTTLTFTNGLLASGSSTIANLTMTNATTTNLTLLDQLNFAATGAHGPLAIFNGLAFITASSTGDNVSMGIEALDSVTSGTSNVAIGNGALTAVSSGSSNMAIGTAALFSNTSGGQNAAIGHQAMFTNTNGGSNVAIGYAALHQMDGVSGNTAIGAEALRLTTNGGNNTAIGSFALRNNETGASNVAIGRNAADNLTSGNRNIIIGADINAPLSTGSNQLSIGNLLFGTGLDGTGTTTSSGNIGVGTSSPYAKLTVAGASAAEYFIAASTTATSTFAGNFNVGNGALLYDNASGLTSIGNLAIGALEFDADSGMVSWLDMPVTTDSATGTVNSYTAQIDGFPILTIYSEADGAGGIFATSTRIGIGTTTPWGALTIVGGGYGEYGGNSIEILTDDTVGAGITLESTAGGKAWGIFSGGNSSADGAGTFTIFDLEAFETRLMIASSTGNVGIGTTTPSSKLTIDGTVSLNNLSTGPGAGALCLSADGEVLYNAGAPCNTSSQRFKHGIEPSALGLEAIMAMRPVSYFYNDDIGVKGEQLGFIAEEIAEIDRRLVVLDASSTPFTVKYDQLTAVLARAIQDIAGITGVFKDNLIAWLGSAENGIASLFTKTLHAENVYADTVTTERLCVGDESGQTCVTKAELDSLLEQAQVAGASDTREDEPEESEETEEPAEEEETGESASTTPKEAPETATTTATTTTTTPETQSDDSDASNAPDSDKTAAATSTTSTSTNAADETKDSKPADEKKQETPGPQLDETVTSSTTSSQAATSSDDE